MHDRVTREDLTSRSCGCRALCCRLKDEAWRALYVLEFDYSLIRMPSLRGRCTAAVDLLARSTHEPKVGDPICVVGHPGGHPRQISHGVIQSINGDTFTHSAAITYGSSGSMVFNSHTMEVIGMVTTTSGAVRMSTIRRRMEQEISDAATAFAEIESMRAAHRAALEAKLRGFSALLYPPSSRGFYADPLVATETDTSELTKWIARAKTHLASYPPPAPAVTLASSSSAGQTNKRRRAEMECEKKSDEESISE
jgi:hypothetical protein